jgi:hypothetical protein
MNFEKALESVRRSGSKRRHRDDVAVENRPIAKGATALLERRWWLSAPVDGYEVERIIAGSTKTP